MSAHTNAVLTTPERDGLTPSVPHSDYLLYGRLYVPSSRLDALYSTRLSSTLQALVAAISDPRADLKQSQSTRTASSPSNIMFNLQHDTGRWCTEYTYSAEDSMLGIRLLHNFGKLAPTSASLSGSAAASDESERSATSRGGTRVKMKKRIDEEDAMEGGLKGRISAGAEIYFSAKEKSTGGPCPFITVCATKYSKKIANTTRTSDSVDGHSIHHLPGCPIIRGATTITIFPILFFPFPLLLRFRTADHDHRPLQPDDGPHVRRIHRAGIQGSLPEHAVRFQCLQLRKRMDDGRRVVAPPVAVKARLEWNGRRHVPYFRGVHTAERRHHWCCESSGLDVQRGFLSPCIMIW